MKMINSPCRQSGFTVIEALIMVIIVLFLAAVIMPSFLDVEGRAQRLKIKQNMIIVQKAAETYAINNNGEYPLKADDPGLRSFFPGGNADSKNPIGGNYPENPFTHMQEAPVDGNIVDVKQARYSPPLDLRRTPRSWKNFLQCHSIQRWWKPYWLCHYRRGKKRQSIIWSLSAYDEYSL